MKACITIRAALVSALGSLLMAACSTHSTAHTASRGPDASLSSDAGPQRDAELGSEPPDIARAMATFEPTVAAVRGTDGPISLWGRADLWEHGQDVTLRLEIRGCEPGAVYQAHVQAGSDCSEHTLAGATWPAGDDIDPFGCAKASSSIIAYYARRADHDKPWTLGGARDSDVVGHAITLSEATTGKPVACAVIERAPDAPASETSDTQGPTLQIRAAVAGVCVFDKLITKSEPNCPDYAEAVQCATTYCELNRCIDSCATYVKCLAQARGLDVCMAAYTCEPSEDCTHCQSEVVRCEQDVCLDKLTCATPATPDGPCSQLLQCCTTHDADPATCLEYTRKFARLAGDAECQQLLDNWNKTGGHSTTCLFN